MQEDRERLAAVPSFHADQAADWEQIDKLAEKSGGTLQSANEYFPSLITDFYAYNAVHLDRSLLNMRSYDPKGTLEGPATPHVWQAPHSAPTGGLEGLHWLVIWPWKARSRLESDEGENFCCS